MTAGSADARAIDSSGPLRVADVVAYLRELATLDLAESWDNVGLLWGDDSQHVSRIITCLTLTPDVADEAVRRRAELIVTHHPILFRPIQRLTSESVAGRMLLGLAKNGISVYSAHTAYDSAEAGINKQLADRLGLEATQILRAKCPDESEVRGAGRYGRLVPPRSLGELIGYVKTRLDVRSVDFVGQPDRKVDRVAIACGAGADFLDDAIACDCQVLLTGEARFHACLEARERGLALILIGHFASERPAMLQLAEQIAQRFPSLDVQASAVETDPLQRA